MSKVLLTGFEPFAGASLNPSKMIVEALAGTEGVETLILPVEYAAASDLLEKSLNRFPQSMAIISLGQAEGRSALSFERLAVNLDDAKLPDNSGEVRLDRPIDPAGPTARFTTLPVKEMVAAVREVGVAAELSMTAGTFVCNHIFYRLQQHTAGREIVSGFVHVPLAHEQSSEFPGRPTMSLKELVLGIKTAIAVVG